MKKEKTVICIASALTRGSFRIGEAAIPASAGKAASPKAEAEDLSHIPETSLEFASAEDRLVYEFEREGLLASYHYAGRMEEHHLGTLARNRALRIAKAHPELLPRFEESAKRFLWVFSCDMLDLV